MNKEEAIWLACAIDGEGWIGKYVDPRNKNWPVLELGVSNTNKDFVDKASSIMGTTTRPMVRHSGMGKKPMWRSTRKGSQKILKILKEIRPYLIIKKTKADMVIKFIEGREWGNKSPEARKHKSISIKKSWENPEIRARRLAWRN